MARETARRRAVVVLVAVGALTGLTLGVFALRAWRPFERSTGEPAAWPTNIAPLADFVEHTTDTTFRHPIRVTFLTGDAYATAVGATGGIATSDANDDAIGRAMGLWNGRPSVAIAAAGGQQASSFPAVWRPDRDDLLVRATGARARLSPRSRFTITAVLTEVLQEQRYGTTSALAHAPSAQEREALQMLSVGQAAWVGGRYVDEMGTADSDEIDVEFAAAADARAQVDDATPASRLLSRDLRQRAGETFIAALQTMNPGAIGKAFTTARPTAVDQVVLPATKYLHRDRTEAAAAPPVPRGGALIRADIQIGPSAWSLLFEHGLADNVALRAADGWGNDAATAYRLDGRVCVDGRLVADGRAGADRIDAGLRAWAAARPAASDVRIARHDDVLLYSVCDPGADAGQTVVDDEARAAILARTSRLSNEIAHGRSARQAECIWVPLFQQFTVEQVDDDDAAAAPYAAVVAGCTD
ncbi:MAG: hypothetical protein ABIR68_04390 [Ilumatobacteraceae bacterium]